MTENNKRVRIAYGGDKLDGGFCWEILKNMAVLRERVP